MLVGIALAGVVLGGFAGENTPMWLALIGVGLVGIGILMVVTARDKVTTIEKGGQLTIQAKKIIGGATTQTTVPTADIVAVRLSTYIDRTGSGSTGSGKPGSQKRSTLYLVLKNNDTVELGTSTAAMSSFGVNGVDVTNLISKAPLSKEADQVATFLGIPLQADDTSSVTGAIKAVKDALLGEEEAPSTPGAVEAANSQTAAPLPPQPQNPVQPEVSAQPPETIQNQTPDASNRPQGS